MVIIFIDFVLFQQPEIMNCSEGDGLVDCRMGTDGTSVAVRLPVLVRSTEHVCCLLVCEYRCQIRLQIPGDVLVTEIMYF